MCSVADIPSNPTIVFTFKVFLLLQTYVLEGTENTETNINTQKNESCQPNGLVAVMV
jgi:TRAP-type C4-dicarboxylate transport system substrate-binding protein